MGPQDPPAAAAGEAAPQGEEEALAMGGRLARDWVPIQEYGVGWGVPPQGVTNRVLVAPRDISLPTAAGTAPTEIAVVETETEVATTRVVGQVLITGPDVPTLIIERIRVGILDNAGLTAFFTGDFTDGQGANEPFLWQRVSVVGSAGGAAGADSARNMGPLAHPFWSAIDVRVGRRLTQDKALFYSVYSDAPIGGDSITVRPFLRTLARLI